MIEEEREWFDAGTVFRSTLNEHVWIGMPADSTHFDTEAGGVRAVKAWVLEWANNHSIFANFEDPDTQKFRWVKPNEHMWSLEVSVLPLPGFDNNGVRLK